MFQISFGIDDCGMGVLKKFSGGILPVQLPKEEILGATRICLFLLLSPSV